MVELFDANFVHWAFTLEHIWLICFKASWRLDDQDLSTWPRSQHSGFKEGEGLGATLWGFSGLTVTRRRGLDGSREVGREKSLLPCRGAHPHQPALLLQQAHRQLLFHDDFIHLYLFFWIVILHYVDDFSDFKLEFVHVLCLVFVSCLHLVEHTRGKIVSCGAWVRSSSARQVVFKLLGSFQLQIMQFFFAVTANVLQLFSVNFQA